VCHISSIINRIDSRHSPLQRLLVREERTLLNCRVCVCACAVLLPQLSFFIAGETQGGGQAKAREGYTARAHESERARARESERARERESERARERARERESERARETLLRIRGELVRVETQSVFFGRRLLVVG
jgi:hypothetical protein